MSAPDALAARLVDAWRSGIPLSAAEALQLAPSSADEAYVVQRMVGDALGWFPRGRARAWKIASRPPTAAAVPDAFIIDAGNSPASLSRADTHTLIGIEVELVFELASALPPGADEEQAARAIGRIRPAIEIFDVRAHDWRTLPPEFLLADHQMHGRLILGDGICRPWNEDDANTTVRLSVNGERVIERRGGHTLGSPVAILPWLAAHVASHGDGLKSGDMIASGTWTGLYEAHVGDDIEAEYPGIGRVLLQVRK